MQHAAKIAQQPIEYAMPRLNFGELERSTTHDSRLKTRGKIETTEPASTRDFETKGQSALDKERRSLATGVQTSDGFQIRSDRWKEKRRVAHLIITGSGMQQKEGDVSALQEQRLRSSA